MVYKISPYGREDSCFGDSIIIDDFPNMPDNKQLVHRDHSPSVKKSNLSIIANDMSSPLNVGSLFRLCDALGLYKLYLCGNTATLPNSKINKTSRSTEKYVDYEYYENAEQLINKLKTEDTFIISLEITSTSIAIDSAIFQNLLKPKAPTCLILGSENTGINKTLLSLSDVTTHIPMHGKNSSMNVISAASIACYEIIQNL
ncbi:MAG: TrmH family RNA methyltransferase [Gammaproteobacteria bacterium]|nr:TrmH family RNA methyltransferase [Gammaproteobacteria bacterium]